MHKRSTGEKIFAVFNYAIMLFLLIITLYPCLYVVFASVSDPVRMYSGNPLMLWPRGFNLLGYEYVLDYKLLWIGYRNTIFYVVAGTVLNVLLTIMAAYCLSRRNLVGQNVIIMGMVFTMYFSGGMIPTYLVVKGVHLLNSPLAMIIPGAINTTNFIISLTYFRGMPYELEEAAKIDGATNMQVLFKVLAPLAKPVIMVMVLYYAVIVVSTIPILCVYPFIQKHFVKGVMMGAVKG